METVLFQKIRGKRSINKSFEICYVFVCSYMNANTLFKNLTSITDYCFASLGPVTFATFQIPELWVKVFVTTSNHVTIQINNKTICSDV